MAGLLESPVFQDFALPFLFVFSLTFGVLRVSGVFKDNDKVDILIGLIIAAFAVTNSSTVSFIRYVMPIAVLGMVGVFGIVFLWKIGKMLTEGEKMDWGVVAVLLMGAMLALMSPATWSIIPANRLVDKSDILFIAGLVVVGALFLFAHRSEGSPGSYSGLERSN